MEHISGASAEAQAESVRDFASVSDDHWFGLSVPNCLAPARPSEIRAHDHPKRACSPSHRDWRCLGARLAAPALCVTGITDCPEKPIQDGRAG